MENIRTGYLEVSVEPYFPAQEIRAINKDYY